MKDVNYVEVPATEAVDINKGKTKWRNGRCVAIDEGRYKTLFIGHRDETDTDDEGVGVKVVKAFPVRVGKPVTRDAAINAAEMEAYGLRTAMDVASFNASLARKSREDFSDEEVREHDEFIAWVKTGLTEIGMAK